MRFGKLALRVCATAAVCGLVGLMLSGDTPGAQAGGSGNVIIPTVRAAWNATDFTVALSADSITTLSNCYADPTVIASGSGAPVTFGSNSLTDTTKSFTTNALTGKPVAVSGQLIMSGYSPTYGLTTVTDASANYAVNSLAGLAIVAEDVRGSGAGVTYTSSSVTDTSKALAPNTLNGLGILASWGLSTSVSTVASNTATTITITGGWVGNGTPAAGATYTVSTIGQATGRVVSNTATVITIAGTWSPSTPPTNRSYSISMPAAKISGSGGTVSYTRRDTGAAGSTYGGSSLTDSSKAWTANEFSGATVTSGANSAVVASNTATSLTLSAPWSPATPSGGSAYVISGSVQDTSKTLGVNQLAGLSIVGIAPASSGSGGSVTYGSFEGSGGTVTYGANTLTDTALALAPNGLVGKTVVAGSVSGVVQSNTATVVTLTAAWSLQPVNGSAYVIAWLTDTSKSYAVNSLAGRTVVSGSSEAVVFSNTATSLTMQTAWTPSLPTPGAAYTVTPQADSGVVSTNTATRISLSSGWSPFAPPAGSVYYVLLSTVNGSIASNTATTLTLSAPWSPAVPSNGSGYSVANSQPVSVCGVGSYQTTITFDPTKLQYVSATNGGFITSSGRTLFTSPCLPTTTSNSVSFNCPTNGATPLGPTGSGTLATVKFHPIVAGSGGSTPLTQTTTLSDIQGDNISHVDMSGTVLFSRCADVSGNGAVAIQDVIQILGQVGKTTASPGWDPKYDMTDPIGAITINDVIFALAEVGQSCTFVP